MYKLYFIILIVVACFLDASSAYGQKATEIFIPIGKSPGVSGKHSIMGKIDSVNYQAYTLIVSDSSETYTVKVMEDTPIWLDKSALKLTNVNGDIEDCQVGGFVEVKYKGPEKSKGMQAEWIKVRITNQ